jgi:hypothetical protein
VASWTGLVWGRSSEPRPEIRADKRLPPLHSAVYAGRMNRDDIVAVLDSEIQRLQEARSVIARSSENLRGTVKGKGISAAGRKRIAEAQRKRWAAQKAAKTGETNKEARRSGQNISVAVTQNAAETTT